METRRSSVSTNDAQNTVDLSGRQETFSFRRGTLLKLREEISDIPYRTSSAFQILQIEDRKTVHDSGMKPNLLAERIHASQLFSIIHD
jgi:hypothetical protein